MSTTESRRPPEEADEDLRAKLIRSALEILAEPETPLDLRKVAERAGKSRTAPYLVFGKERDGGGLAALRLGVAAEGTRMLCVSLRQAQEATDDGVLDFHGMAEAFLAFAAEHPRLYRLMFGPEIGVAARGPHSAEETTSEVRRLLQARVELEEISRGVITGAQEARLLPPGDAERTSWITWATLHGLALLRMDGQLDLAGIQPGIDHTVGLASEAVLGTSTDTLGGVALTLLGAKVSKDAAPPELAQDWNRLEGIRDLSPHPWPRGTRGPGTQLASRVIASTPALRRAARSRRILHGARILWIDDHPEWLEWERLTLEQLGADIEVCEDTESALTRLRAATFDLIVSDIARGDRDDAGVADLPLVRKASHGTPVVFYVGVISATRGVPKGAWGVTNQPDELLHLVMDALERSRS